jgi:hypothetical protein
LRAVLHPYLAVVKILIILKFSSTSTPILDRV